MKTITFLSIALMLVGCSSPQPADKQIQLEIRQGNFTVASHLIDSVIAQKTITPEEEQLLLFTKDSMRRVAIDFNKDLVDVVSWIKEHHGFEPTEAQLNQWENEKVLEYRIIDQQKRYFRNAAPNLFRLSESARGLSNSPKPKSDTPKDSLLISAFENKIPNDKDWKSTLKPQTMKVLYTLTVKPDAVSDGETVRAWLPYPRQDIARQTNVKFINASQSDYILSDDATAHTSIYMEKHAKAGSPTIFTVEYEFTSQGEWVDFSKIGNTDLNDYPAALTEFTGEREPHIQFSDTLKKLTDEVTKDAIGTKETVEAIYLYIVENYPWASALEYSTIKNIPEYAIENKKGDCGQVALLLITMLRYKGIPAHWQSGWMMHPGEVNLHDWAEYYIEGIGWIPIDVSFGRADIENSSLPREFFLSGMDSYRLYINNDYSGSFFPEKKYPRSETVDFQRGEVETDSENLYFDKWSYNMEVEYR